ncbi:MAG: nucleoside-diphosphate sugar epimerase [Thermoprotei archaeon]|nr:MAG: nucleoside-diphosphate sugar epimerase [Thermoprotei archaeon]
MIVVTGGAGFIGYHTVKRLIKEGLDVSVIDNLHSAIALEELKKYEIKLNVVDIRDLDKLKTLMKDTEAVLHLAALIDVEESLRNPYLYHQVNVCGTVNILEIARTYDIDKIILASSAAVYGEPSKIPISENSPLRPISPYGLSKVIAERYCKMYHELYGLNVLILRYFNVYGEYQSSEYAGVITKFIERILERKPPVIYGDGRQTRDFVYVNDVVSANLLALKSTIDFGIFNIGTGRAISINELASMLIEMVGLKLKPVYLPPRPGDIPHSVADISHAREVLKYHPRTSLRDGLRRVLEWYRTRRV